jgi:hypothetical protein
MASLAQQGRVIGDDIETQTVHTCQNIERVLPAGGSDLDQILHYCGRRALNELRQKLIKRLSCFGKPLY